MEEVKIVKKQRRIDPNSYWRQLNRLEKLNKSAEVKAGIVFSFHSLIIGLFADRADYFKLLLSENYFILITVILWIVCALISIFFAFKCFKPIIIKEKYDNNVFFFGDVVSKFESVENYAKTIMKITDSKEKLFKQLAQQIHAESSIVTIKFGNVKKSISFFIYSLIFIFLTFTLIFIF